MASLSQHLFALGRPTLERQLAHPTVRGIAASDLESARFRAWLVQDYLFLLDYVRLFALAATRAPDTETLGRLVDLAHATFHQGAVAAPWLCRRVRPWRGRPGPSQEVASLRRLHRLPAPNRRDRQLLPCIWGYSELGQALAAKGLPAKPRYGRWIETYADPDFAGLAAWCADLLDRAADGLPAARLAACERAFLNSLRHELAFWDA